MPGQRFVLKAATIAVMEAPDQRIAIQVPAGAEIMILDLIPAMAGPIEHASNGTRNRF
jgi:hypothetical protein